jgi:polysaccharide export outer membrane protein
MKQTFPFFFAFLFAFTLCDGQTSAGPSPAPTTPAFQRSVGPVQGATAPPPSSATAPPAVAPVTKNPAPAEARGTKKTATAVASDVNPASKPYVIGPLDLLSVNVWNDPKLSGFIDVGPDGMISMQLIGQMKADGLTVNELTDVIKKRLSASVMEDPEVNVQVVKNNSKKFYILSGCQRQGEFALLGAMTFLDGFANCGGFKEFANPKKTYILRGTEKLPFNYKDVSNGKHMEQNRYLQNGDKIFVPE